MIFIHRYELIRKRPANSKTDNLVQVGCLLKITDFENNFGVADICPWPSLGDLNLDQELSQKGPLFQRAIELANKDLQARKNKIHLLSGVQIKNHVLVSDYKNFDFKSAQSGFVKIKGDQSVCELAEILNQLKGFKIRLDFNFRLNEIEFRNFLNLLNPEALKNIDVVEDAFEFNEKSWAELNQKVTLALDWNFKNHQWSNLICKPARQMTDSFLYMTSSMDHPVGVAHGMVMAQKHPDLVHGFNTNDLYEDSGFKTSDGYGIGFEKQLSEIVWEPLIDWTENSENQLMINPKLPIEEKKVLQELSEKFKQSISDKNYFLIPSSGSSKSTDESVRLIALKKSAVLNSAKRVNEQFSLNKEMNWGCVLPTFHVGGLGILARAHLSDSKVFLNDWKTLVSGRICDWIIKNKIQIISLVPAQIYDLVQNNIQSPPILKTVFVGGSELSLALAEKAVALGWPVFQTYGMTETASMIAFKSNIQNDFFELMNGVDVLDSNVSCNSLASYSVQNIKNEVYIENFSESFKLSDQVEVKGRQLKFLGRSDDRIQINSETVSMSELRSRLEFVIIENKLNLNEFALIAIPDERSENKLILVSENINPIVIEQYNLNQRPYEKIIGHVLIKKIPRTDLGKVKYIELIDLVSSELVQKFHS